MIALAQDCLLFQMAGGESIPFSAEMISVELLGGTAELFDADFVRHASHAVFHYFKHDLNRKSVAMSEFAEALEKVLRGFVLTAKPATPEPLVPSGPRMVESDLGQLASESGKGCELFFFPRLRAEMCQQLELSPQVIRFRGLRACVKQLVGARRWTNRCQALGDDIVEYLRQCLSQCPGSGQPLLGHLLVLWAAFSELSDFARAFSAPQNLFPTTTRWRVVSPGSALAC